MSICICLLFVSDPWDEYEEEKYEGLFLTVDKAREYIYANKIKEYSLYKISEETTEPYKDDRNGSITIPRQCPDIHDLIESAP